MSAVVRPRGNLVQKDPAVLEVEHLDPEHARALQRRHCIFRSDRRLLRDGRGNVRRGRGDVADVVRVNSLCHRIRPDLAGLAPDDHDGQLPDERDPLLAVQALVVAAQLGDGVGQISRGLGHRVALAVVSHATRFDHERESKIIRDGLELSLVGDRFEVAEGDAGLGEVFLLRVLVLDDRQRAARGLYVDAHVLELLERLCVDVLDLHGDHVAVLGEGDDVVAVLIGTQGVLGRDGGWGGIGRVEAVELDAHRRRGDGEHAAELAAAQDANLGVPGQPIVAHRVGVVVRLAAEEPRAHADRGTAGGAGGSAAAPGARHGDRRNVGGAHRCEHRDDGFSNRATANWGSGVGGQEETVAGERWADALEEVGCSRAIEPRPIRASAGWCDDWLGPPRPSR